MRFVVFCLVVGMSCSFLACNTQKKTNALVTVKQDGKNAVSDSVRIVLDSIEFRKDVIDTTLMKANVSIKDTITLDPLQQQHQQGLYRAADFAPAMHYDLRRPNYVIIHHTSQNSIAQTQRTFQLPHTKVSAHYVIGRDGQVVQFLNDYERAWHAGKSKWGSLTDINSASIGIELDNNGYEVFPEVQINSLLVLLDTLKTKYLIPQLNFIGHADIAPTRKNDPNVHFPWKKLAEHGFGVWYNEDFLLDPPANFNPIDALKIMGYDMQNPGAAIEAFKRKFIIKEVNKVLNDYDKKVLYDLYRKYY